MIEKTAAIALRIYPVSNTSRVVAWLTASSGRVATLIKGSQRPKSAFLGQYDLFYTCELLYYTKERDHLHIARECAPLKLRASLRTNWRAAAVASYLADVVLRVSPPDAPHQEFFPLLDAGLDHLARRGGSSRFVYWYELKALDALGLAPRLSTCARCNRDLLNHAQRAMFAPDRGGMLCARCGRGGGHDLASVPPAILAMLSNWQRAAEPDSALNTRCDPQQESKIEAILGSFLRYHLETALVSRKIALDTLRIPTKAPLP